jgi:hypothetical protein
MPITKASGNSVTAAAKGDLVVGNATNDSGVLSVGANDTVLTADSSTATGVKWATPAAGGMTLISTTTLTGGSVTLSSIPSTYNNLQLVIRSFKPAGDGEVLWMRFNGDSGTRYKDLSAGTTGQAFDQSFIQISAGNDNSVATGMVVSTIYDYANTETWKMETHFGLTVNPTTTTQLNYRILNGFFNQTGAISSITLGQSGASFTSGTVLLYGVK